MGIMDLFRKKAKTAEVIVSDVEREAELKKLTQERQLRQERERVTKELYERQHPLRTFAKKTASQVGRKIMEGPTPRTTGVSRVSRTGRTGAGRPRSTYKYSIPGRGPVPVKVYKRWLRQQRIMAQMAMQRRFAQQVQPTYQETGEMPPQPPQTPYRAIPARRAGYGEPYTPPAQEMPIPRTQPQSDYTMDVDFFTSRRILRRKPPREAWIS